MRPTLLAGFRLVRLPNLATAAADSWAGAIVAAGAVPGPFSLLALGAVSALIYAFGCVLNDLFDRDLDARERPERPLPSGAIGVEAAAVLAFGLGAAAFLLAFTLGPAVAIIAGALLVLVFAYDFRLKHQPLAGPLAMGGCRALNLVLGMAPFVRGIGWTWLFPGVTLAYVAALTVISRYEVAGTETARGGDPRVPAPLRLGTPAIAAALLPPTLVLAAALSVPALLMATGRIGPAGWVFLGPMLVLVGAPLGRALVSGDPGRVRSAVKWMVLGISLLDATYAAAGAGLGAGLLVAATLPTAVLAARRIAVT